MSHSNSLETVNIYCQVKFHSDKQEISALTLMTKMKEKFISIDKKMYIISTNTCEKLKKEGIDIIDIVHGKKV